jgi:hypothetical protein
MYRRQAKPVSVMFRQSGSMSSPLIRIVGEPKGLGSISILDLNLRYFVAQSVFPKHLSEPIHYRLVVRTPLKIQDFNFHGVRSGKSFEELDSRFGNYRGVANSVRTSEGSW